MDAITYKDQLEALVDTFDLAQIVTMLSEIASDKADHLIDDWQDENTARAWRKASNILSLISGRIHRLGV